MIEILTPPEARVLGCLIEKQMTTPEYYPMTVNALVAACNQKNNRDPVVTYDDEIVEHALRSLNDRGGLTKFTRSPGARALKYVHKGGDVLEVDDHQLALISVMLLRGPQTAGELRTRTERYIDFEGVPAVEEVLNDLIHRDEPLVEKIHREPGQREERFRSLLADWDPATVGRPQASDRLEQIEARLARIEEALGL